MRWIKSVLLILCLSASPVQADFQATNDALNGLRIRAFILSHSPWEWARVDVPRFHDHIGIIQGHLDDVIGWSADAPPDVIDWLLWEIDMEIATLGGCLDWYDGGGQKPTLAANP